MDVELWIYIILAAIIIIALIIIILWTTVIQTPPVFPPAPNYTLTGFGMKCSSTPVTETTNDPNTYVPPPCSVGLICHGGFCLKNIGSECNTIFECVPGTITCNGFCSATGRTGLNGRCSTNADCDTSFICDTSVTPAVCKRPIGSSGCFQSSDCVTGSVCSNNVCVPLEDGGLPCAPVVDSDSCNNENICLNYGNNYYFCQPPLVTPGGEGALCYYWNDTSIPQPALPLKNVTLNSVVTTVPSCATNFQCNSEGDVNGISEYGKCANSDPINVAGWFDNCSIVNGCQTPQVCVNGLCLFPFTLTSGLLDLQPLLCENGRSTGICLNNYTCNTNTNKCVGIGNGIPATSAASCNSGIGGYNVVTQTFQDINSNSTNRLTTASWASAGLIVPGSINDSNINQVNFSTIETVNGNINAIFHIIGDNTYVIATTSSNTTVVISTNIRGLVTVGLNNFMGKVAKVDYTTTGNYYCIIEYTPTSGPTFSNIYISTLSNFSDAVPYCTPYVVDYYLANLPFSFNSTYIYSVSVDDRIIDPNIIFPVDVRVFMTTGNNGSYNNTQFNQQGRLASLRIVANTLLTVSQGLAITDFNLLSYTSSGAIDNTLVWCQAFVSRTMDPSLASQYCLGYQNDSNIALIYGPFPNLITNVGNTPVFPTRFYTNFTLNQIATYNSRSTDLFNDPCYYIGNQGLNTQQVAQVYLGLTWANIDANLPGDVDLNTKISVPFVAPINDNPGYAPKICMLTKTCI